MGKLILVPTPIGNLEDITLRAIRILKEADLILAEDTRVTGKLLKHLEIQRPMQSFHIHNEHTVLNAVIEKVKANNNVILVSDAGTPGISDPGFLLVRACIEANLLVECLPGPSALIPALVISGFPTDRFVFEGFLPHKKGRQTRLLKIAEEKRTTLLYESPHRLTKCLAQIEEIMGADKEVCVVRELSKIHEECRRGSAFELKNHYTSHPPKGEIVVLIKGTDE